MNPLIRKLPRLLAVATTLLLFAFNEAAWAVIDGITGPTFNLAARADYIVTADGNSIYTWGYANGNGQMQYPGPTLIVNQGQTVTINLSNELPVPVSMVFPGQSGVEASGGFPGPMAVEATPGNTITYTFVASNAGTYMYHSGTQPSLQVEMGLIGALIVRPSGGNALTQAYGSGDSKFDREYLFLMTEMDPNIHSAVWSLAIAGIPPGTRTLNVDTVGSYFPVLWFLNGRAAPDTMADAFSPIFPTQPYNCLPRMHPGEQLLLRVVNAGRDLHPFHTHGNNFDLIARDGRLLGTAANTVDLSVSDFTLKAVPGETYDAIFTWTGQKLGWDYTGNNNDFPVILPSIQDLTIGTNYSGSPFLGQFGSLPPGIPTVNPNAGYFFMWHSHNEKEITNNDIFPGGMMTMLIVEAPGVPIP